MSDNNEDFANESEAAPSIDTSRPMTMNNVVANVCSICEQSLMAALHSAGLPAEDRDRVVHNYRSNVEQSFKQMRRPKNGE